MYIYIYIYICVCVCVCVCIDRVCDTSACGITRLQIPEGCVAVPVASSGKMVFAH